MDTLDTSACAQTHIDFKSHAKEKNLIMISEGIILKVRIL